MDDIGIIYTNNNINIEVGIYIISNFKLSYTNILFDIKNIDNNKWNFHKYDIQNYNTNNDNYTTKSQLQLPNIINDNNILLSLFNDTNIIIKDGIYNKLKILWKHAIYHRQNISISDFYTIIHNFLFRYNELTDSIYPLIDLFYLDKVYQNKNILFVSKYLLHNIYLSCQNSNILRNQSIQMLSKLTHFYDSSYKGYIINNNITNNNIINNNIINNNIINNNIIYNNKQQKQNVDTYSEHIYRILDLLVDNINDNKNINLNIRNLIFHITNLYSIINPNLNQLLYKLPKNINSVNAILYDNIEDTKHNILTKENNKISLSINNPDLSNFNISELQEILISVDCIVDRNPIFDNLRSKIIDILSSKMNK